MIVLPEAAASIIALRACCTCDENVSGHQFHPIWRCGDNAVGPMHDWPTSRNWLSGTKWASCVRFNPSSESSNTITGDRWRPLMKPCSQSWPSRRHRWSR
ncbi:uncharacterized protein BJ171DRAFT_542040 [Polychytrium aggregatum]|uniref:uncharacterized protein n=1 Tax=Polychytrium aggregatum TaxID=110093 RepID=UPI0022FE8C37|nr:uncharacterized protein BJ171DRAFT_542040 [Polychytrium aggregatum]KAI9190691.1 hypothetical protein BJ171DRAFT_542040 [Polychytrium aggregatum]